VNAGTAVAAGPLRRVATWNVLAQAYCDPRRYADVGAAALDADTRRRLVVHEVVRRVDEVDVVCLQEADGDLVDALVAAGVWVHAVPHPDRADGVAVVAGAVLGAEQGDLGGGMAWAGAVLDDPDGGHTIVVSCHLRHPGDGPVGVHQAGELTSGLRSRFGDARWVVGADANAEVGGPATAALAGLGLELHQPRPTAWISGGPRTTDVLGLPAGGRCTAVAGPTGPIPTTSWPSDHRLLLGEWPQPGA